MGAIFGTYFVTDQSWVRGGTLLPIDRGAQDLVLCYRLIVGAGAILRYPLIAGTGTVLRCQSIVGEAAAEYFVTKVSTHI